MRQQEAECDGWKFRGDENDVRMGWKRWGRVVDEFFVQPDHSMFAVSPCHDDNMAIAMVGSGPTAHHHHYMVGKRQAANKSHQ